MFKKHKWIWDYIIILVGAVLAAFAVEVLLLPNNILDGGVVGISMLTSILTKMPLSILTIVINIPFFIIGYKAIGKHFVVRAVFANIIFSLSTFGFSHIEYETDELLAVCFGGAILGLGIGLILKHGACIDGTEIIGTILNRRFNTAVGTFVLICNVVIYGLSSIFFGFEVAMYSLLTYFIATKVMDFVEEGLNSPKMAMIVTEEKDYIVDAIYKKLGRTTTTVSGQGAISGEKAVIYCVITTPELLELRDIINASEKSSFTTVFSVDEIIGKFVKEN